MNQSQLFDLTYALFQNPAYVSSQTGTKIIGTFLVKPIDAQAAANAQKGLTGNRQVVVGDISGSMTGERLMALKEAVTTIVTNLADGDYIGMIVFSGENSARWLWNIEKVTSKSRQKMLTAIANLDTEGSTCFSEPLSMAIDELTAAPEMIRQIQFLSDGENNSGGMSFPGVGFLGDRPAALLLCEKIAQLGIDFHVYGISMDYDQKYMAEMTNKGNATFYHISTTGSGLGNLMVMNAVRASLAAATDVTVEIRCAPGFQFFKNETTGEYEVYRKFPNDQALTPIKPDWLVDDQIGSVNAAEGVPYQITLVNKNLQIPAGQTEWDETVATMVIRYRLTDGEHEETIHMVQRFTTDLKSVVTDRSVRDTMQKTAVNATANDLLAQLSAAQTMGNTAAMRQISMQLTNLKTQADNVGLNQLSADLGEIVAGMGSGNTDQVLSKATQLMRSADMGALLGGMGQGGEQ